MKIIPFLSSKLAVIAVLSVFKSGISNAQCGSPVFAGSSANILTISHNRPIAVNKSLNTAVFIYRNDHVAFGGNSGQLRYGISTNNGATWSVNKGPINAGSSFLARFPGVVIHNPALNTNTASAYLGYIAPSLANTNAWSVFMSGSGPLSGGAFTEYNGQAGTNTVIALTSLTKGAPDTFWCTGILPGPVGTLSNSVIIYRGSWNGSNDITWTTNTVLTIACKNTAYPNIGYPRIAFDPSGNTGWLAIMTDLANGPSHKTYYPLFYKTTNGGNTWTGPELVDPNNFSCITSSVTGAVVGSAPVAALGVDMDGNPHLLVPVGYSNGNYALEYNKWHHLFDITQKHGLWTAYDVAPLITAPHTFSAYSQPFVSHDFSLQMARSDDASKLFFGWSDKPSASLGLPNTEPDLLARGFDVQQYKWTPVKNFSSCNPSTAGRIYFCSLAADVLEPAPGQYKLAPGYAQFSPTANPAVPVNLMFLDSCLFYANEFTIQQPVAPVVAQPGLNLALCPGNTLTLQLSGNYSQAMWYNNVTTMSVPVTATGTYSVAVRAGCEIGSATFTIGSLYFDPTFTTTSICEGDVITLVAAGNALAYSWQPGALSGSTVAVSPSVTTIYTVAASAGGACKKTAEVEVVVSVCTNLTEQATMNAIQVFPVPSSGYMTIRSDGEADLNLFNETGELIRHFRLGDAEGHQFHLKELSRGLYFLTGTIDNKPIGRKLLIY